MRLPCFHGHIKPICGGAAQEGLVSSRDVLMLGSSWNVGMLFPHALLFAQRPTPTAAACVLVSEQDTLVHMLLVSYFGSF